MKIADDCVVSMHYTLTDEEGTVIDSSKGSEPLKFLQGAGNIILGLEQALVGCEAGDQKTVIVQPEDGYGEHDPSLIQTLPREVFSGIDKIEVGMEFHAEGPNGEAQAVIVKEVADDDITIDANHELAGMVLNFDVSVEDVRASTAEELDHGHVH